MDFSEMRHPPMASPTEWVSAGEACAALRLSKHQLRHAINRGTLLPGEHWLPGPTPNSPRRYNVAAIQQCLIEVAQNKLRQDKSTALAEPEPEGLTDDELDDLAAEAGLDLAWRPELRRFARFALARTAAAILQPIPVSKELPWELDCDAEGRCWWGDAGDDEFVPSWRLCEQPDKPCFEHWLPHWALPVREKQDKQ